MRQDDQTDLHDSQHSPRQYGRLLAGTEAMGGPDHPDSITARAKLAAAYRPTGLPTLSGSTRKRWQMAGATSAPTIR